MLDNSCHEDYFSIVLDEYFKNVTGIYKNSDSLNKTEKMSSLLGYQGISCKQSSIEDCGDKLPAEFVLCFGLLYHVENSVQIPRELALLTKKSLRIETRLTGSIDRSFQMSNMMSLLGSCRMTSSFI